MIAACLHITPITFQADGWSFERSGYYISKKGIVIVQVMRWKTNFAPLIYTEFKTVAKGEIIKESWYTADFSDKTLQVKAARFLHQAQKSTV